MNAKEVLKKHCHIVRHHCGRIGNTMVEENDAIEAMENYAKQKAWEAWSFVRSRSHTQTEVISHFAIVNDFEKWWEENI